MPKWCVEIWYNILEEAVGNLSSPKHRPLSSGTRIHSDVCYKIIKYYYYDVLKEYHVPDTITQTSVHTSSAFVEINEVLHPKLEDCLHE